MPRWSLTGGGHLWELRSDIGSKFYLNSIWLQRLVPSLKCFIHVERQYREKNLIFPIDKFPFLVFTRMRQCYNTLLPNFWSIICKVVAYGWLKLKQKTKSIKFKLVALKVVAVAYERCSLSRGFRYVDLNWKLLLFWKTGRQQRWSKPEVPLYFF